MALSFRREEQDEEARVYGTEYQVFVERNLFVCIAS